MNRYMIAAFAGLVSAGCAAAPALAADKIVVNQSAQSLSAAAIYIAEAKGFFEEQDLDVEFVATGSGIKSIVPLLNGQSQFCACIFSHQLDAVNAGAGEVKVIGTLMSGYAHQIVIGKDFAEEVGFDEEMSLEEKMQLLKGQNVGITSPNSSTDQVMRFLMEMAGMNPDRDATLIALGAENLPAALANHQISAFIMTPPVPERSIMAGDAIPLVQLTEMDAPPLTTSIFMTIATSADYLEDNRDVAVRLLKAVAAAETFLAENPDEARKILKEAQFNRMDQETFDIAFEGNQPLYAKSPEVTMESVEAGFELARKFAREELTVTPEVLVDTTVASEALGN